MSAARRRFPSTTTRLFYVKLFLNDEESFLRPKAALNERAANSSSAQSDMASRTAGCCNFGPATFLPAAG